MMFVLLLNASFEPLRLIPQRRAISLLLRNCVDAAAEETLVVRGGQTSFHVPLVLRLRRYINLSHLPRRGVRWSRRGVLQRDTYQCIYCGIAIGAIKGGKVMNKRDFTLDHIVPQSRGGQHSWTNTACACAQCNQRKGNRLPHEAGMQLRWKPRVPRVDYLVASGDVPDAWKLYLQ